MIRWLTHLYIQYMFQLTHIFSVCYVVSSSSSDSTDKTAISYIKACPWITELTCEEKVPDAYMWSNVLQEMGRRMAGQWCKGEYITWDCGDRNVEVGPWWSPQGRPQFSVREVSWSSPKREGALAALSLPQVAHLSTPPTLAPQWALVGISDERHQWVLLPRFLHFHPGPPVARLLRAGPSYKATAWPSWKPILLLAPSGLKVRTASHSCFIIPYCFPESSCPRASMNCPVSELFPCKTFWVSCVSCCESHWWGSQEWEDLQGPGGL